MSFKCLRHFRYRTIQAVVLAGAIALLLSGCFDSKAGEGLSSPPESPNAGVVPPTPTITLPAFSGPPTPVISTSPSPPGTNRWSTNAIWENVGGPTAATHWQTYCGVEGAARFNPRNSGLDCVVEVMQVSGAHPEAIEFLQEYGYFLGSFVELGTIDFGRGWAPWLNMGRPQQVLLLNGIPSNVDVTDELRLRFVDTGEGPAAQSYSALLDQVQSPVPWFDRTLLSSSEPSDRGQAITLNVALQNCRACDVRGYMPVEFIMSEAGMLLESKLLPLAAP